MLEEVGNFLLRHYRAKNEEVRSKPPPRHFNQSWRLKRSELPANPAEPGIDDEVRAAQDAIEVSITEISDAYAKAIKNFEDIDAIKRSLTSG